MKRSWADMRLAFAVCSPEPLIAGRLVVEAAKLFDIAEHFVDRVRDGVHIGVAAQEILVRKPYCFVVGGAIGFGTGIHISQIERLFAPPTESREIGRINGE